MKIIADDNNAESTLCKIVRQSAIATKFMYDLSEHPAWEHSPSELHDEFETATFAVQQLAEMIAALKEEYYLEHELRHQSVCVVAKNAA